MAKAIVEKDVAAVLLSDGWHEVVSDSFELDLKNFIFDDEKEWVAAWREEKNSDHYSTCLVLGIKAFRMKVVVELPE